MTEKKRKTQRTSKSDNPTLQRLAGTPFKSAKELNEAEERIYKETWEELTKAKSYNELTQKKEFEFFKKDFEKGMRCRYGSNSEDIVSISIEDGTPVVAINEDMKSKGHSEKFVTALAQALSDSFYSNYLRSMRRLPLDDPEREKAVEHLSGKKKE
ncbi:MAG: hypothetical protein H6618_06435 [Deltaproteobacteria bacterium]|nr:hypothetical protein [Deltaproteobacteria bacterium]